MRVWILYRDSGEYDGWERTILGVFSTWELAENGVLRDMALIHKGQYRLGVWTRDRSEDAHETWRVALLQATISRGPFGGMPFTIWYDSQVEYAITRFVVDSYD